MFVYLFLFSSSSSFHCYRVCSPLSILILFSFIRSRWLKIFILFHTIFAVLLVLGVVAMLMIKTEKDLKLMCWIIAIHILLHTYVLVLAMYYIFYGIEWKRSMIVQIENLIVVCGFGMSHEIQIHFPLKWIDMKGAKNNNLVMRLQLFG